MNPPTEPQHIRRSTKGRRLLKTKTCLAHDYADANAMLRGNLSGYVSGRLDRVVTWSMRRQQNTQRHIFTARIWEVAS
jgi:hypothetical protein